jgi:hypothetical protein
MKQEKQKPSEQGHESTRHEQEDAASRDYKHQREGGFEKTKDAEKPQQTPP